MRLYLPAEPGTECHENSRWTFSQRKRCLVHHISQYNKFAQSPEALLDALYRCTLLHSRAVQADTTWFERVSDLLHRLRLQVAIPAAVSYLMQN